MVPLSYARLADLHHRYDGPIPESLRDTALAGVAGSAGPPCRRFSRDIDRLALSTARSLAHLRTSAGSAAVLPLVEAGDAVSRLATAMRYYRSIGVLLVSATSSGASAARISATDSESP